jgi:hypothetical protein
MYESGELAQMLGVEQPAGEAPAAAEPGAPPLQLGNNLAQNQN